MLFASRQMQYNERYGSAFLVLEKALWPNLLRTLNSQYERNLLLQDLSITYNQTKSIGIIQ